jgi:hypothetical protein
MNQLVKVLMQRDDLTKAEAIALVKECAVMVNEGHCPEEVLLEELGLEPDYLFDLLEYV